MVGYLELVGDEKFRCVDADENVNNNKDDDGEKYGEVTDELADERGEDCRLLEVLEDDSDEEGAEEKEDTEEEDVGDVLMAGTRVITGHIGAPEENK